MTSQAFTPSELPAFNAIDPASIEPTLIKLLAEHRKKLTTLLAETKDPTYDAIFQPLEVMSDQLSQFWSPISHLHSVLQSDPLRKAYNKSLPILTEYHTELSQNEALYHAIESISKRADFTALSAVQRKIIEDDLRDFKLAGIHLSKDKKARMKTLNQQLTELETKFSENLLDATNAWTLHFTDKTDLEGLPEQAMQLAIANAKQRGLEGYVLTLDYPSYSTAIKFLNDRELRKKIYTAYVTRASELFEHNKKLDNTLIMEEIIKLRHEMANLVGYQNFADYSLATKMAKSPNDVLDFLGDLLKRTRSIATTEFQEITELAKKEDGVTDIGAWDLSYYSEKLQMSKYDFTQEDFRPYFPIQKVLDGLFSLVNKLYGITLREQSNVETWHPDVRFFGIYDEKNALRGGIYIDLYARTNKREGAWMDECRTRYKLPNHQIQNPVAYLTCNFMQPVDNQPALLTHNDVLTLFHEFGHCLHHTLTQVDYLSASGINGVAWDAVEFPSQFMENYCWEKELLTLISGHYKTGEPIPDALYDKLLAAKHFQTGLQMVRQLEFALFDFRLHLEYDPAKSLQVQAKLDEIRKHTSVTPIATFNRFQHSFGHIFAGGYAAGYYSYKWAEVLSSDAYAKFEEEGLYNHQTGLNFLKNILEVGGGRDPMDSFIAFRGRKPTVDALLRHCGITGDHAAASTSMMR